MKLLEGTRKMIVTVGLLGAILFTPTVSIGQQMSLVNTVSTAGIGDDRKAIEEIVRQYLLSNPHIIREALEALKLKEQRLARERLAAKLSYLKKELFEDPTSPFKGNKDADVPIVVFFDYNCGYCKSTLPALDSIIDGDPKTKILFKEFPIMGQGSILAAKAALAARDQGKYEEFHAQLLYAAEIDLSVIKSISDSLKLDTDLLLETIKDPKLDKIINSNHKLADSLGISGTPVYVVGDQLIPGAIDVDSLKRLLAQERAKRDRYQGQK